MDTNPRQDATALDVAQLAGVSQSTVSRVFNGQSKLAVREETREKVLKAAQELGYAPNAIAKTMASGRSDLVGIVVPSTFNLFHYHALQLLAGGFKARSLQSVVIPSDPADDMGALLQGLYQYRVCGVVVTSAALRQGASGGALQKRLPTVLFNSDLPGANVSMVQSDHFGGGVRMAEHLLETGRRRFAYVSAGRSPHLDLRARQEGFLQGLRDHGITDCRILPAAYSYESGYQAGCELLRLPELPDAVFCAGDVNGFGVMDAIRRESSLRIGADIAVAGYDAPVIRDFAGYSMTALSQPIEQLAEDAVDLLVRMIEDPDQPVRKIVRPLTLIVRSSTRSELRRMEPETSSGGRSVSWNLL